MDVDGRRKKGRWKRMWIDSVNVDLREKGMSVDETPNRATTGQTHRAHIEMGNDAMEEEEVVKVIP